MTHWTLLAIGWFGAGLLQVPDVATAAGQLDRVDTPTTAAALGRSLATGAAERQLRAATGRLDGLEGLQQSAAQAQAQVRVLERASQALRHQSTQAAGMQDRARTAIEGLPECHRTAAAAAQRGLEQVAATRQAQVASRHTVQAVSHAAAAAVAAAARRADAGFAARAAAEQAGVEATAQAQAQRSACAELTGQAAAASSTADAQLLALRRDADALADRVDAVRRTWARAGDQARLAQQRGWLPVAAAAGVDLRTRGSVDALKAAAGAPPRSGGGIAIPAAVRVEIASADRFVQNLEQRALVDDAAAMLQGLADGCAASAAPGCDGLKRQQDDLAARSRDLDTLIERQQRSLIDATEGGAAEGQRLRAAAESRQARLTAMQNEMGGALAEAAFVATQAQRAARSLQARVDPAVDEAERSLAAAFEVARGRPFPGRDHRGGETAAPGAPGMSMPMAAPLPQAQLPETPRLAGHAWKFIAGWDAEREGFGAYTYVLLRSGSDLRKPGVQRRWRALLEVVLREREGTAVPASEAPFVNLFCIPGTRPDRLTRHADQAACNSASTGALARLSGSGLRIR
ncbi:MAG: hypothetical protein ABIN96_04320 [Rubrivivax sp.]